MRTEPEETLLDVESHTLFVLRWFVVLKSEAAKDDGAATNRLTGKWGFPSPVRRLQWPLADPARATGSDGERLDAFRAARDRLRELLPQLWATTR